MHSVSDHCHECNPSWKGYNTLSLTQWETHDNNQSSSTAHSTLSWYTSYLYSPLSTIFRPLYIDLWKSLCSWCQVLQIVICLRKWNANSFVFLSMKSDRKVVFWRYGQILILISALLEELMFHIGDNLSILLENKHLMNEYRKIPMSATIWDNPSMGKSIASKMNFCA